MKDMTATLSIALVCAATTAALLTPMTRRLAARLGAVDREDARRTHQGVTPRLGGLPLAIGATVGVVAAWAHSAAWLVSDPRCWGLVSGAALILGLGLYDDIRNVRPRFKFAVQLAAAGCAYLAGVRIAAIDLPIGGTWDLGWLALPVTLLWLVGVTNAINLLDGIDGLASGVTIVAAVAFLLIGATTGTPDYVVIGAGATIGACAVMGLQTLRSRKLFLGDSGSLLLGFMLANLALLACKKMTGAITLLPACVALGLPLTDTVASIARRALLGRSPFSADRGHIHHALLSLGLCKRRVVVILCGLSVVYGATAWLCATSANTWSLLAIPGVLAFPTVVYWRRGYLSPRAWLSRWRLERLLRRLADRLARAESIDHVSRLGIRVARLLGVEYLCIRRGMVLESDRERRQPLVELGRPGEGTAFNHRIGDGLSVALHHRVAAHPLSPDTHEVLSSPVIRVLAERAAVLRWREFSTIGASTSPSFVVAPRVEPAPPTAGLGERGALRMQVPTYSPDRE